VIKIDIRKKLHGNSGEMNLEVNLQIKKGDFIALAGESGGGKTTLLRTLAGLEEADGEIVVDGTVWQNSKTSLSPQKREIGFVFQDYALFPNMRVIENLLYVRDDKALAKHLLKITGLEKLSDRFPDSLSGGQKQRVSLSRALMGKPKILLLDEPLSALDPSIRGVLQMEILELHREFRTTTIMVSHDPSEIYRLADRMLTLHNGKVVEDGTPKELLLQSIGSQKFSFRGEILSIEKVDTIYIAVIAIGQQIVEVVVSSTERRDLRVGDSVTVSTKAFSPMVRELTI
jgi:molybdate transport system ATP-binding protein